VSQRRESRKVRFAFAVSLALLQTPTLALLLVLAGTAAAEPSGRRAIARVEIEGQGGTSVVVLRFAAPFRYLRHFPETRGADLAIRVAPVGAGGEGLQSRESAPLPAFDDRVPLGDVEFDGTDSAGPTVFVRFSRSVAYRVSQGSDLWSVRIELPGPSALAEVTDGGASRAPIVAAGSFPPPPATSRQVVNLASFDQPIDTTSLPGSGATTGQTLYVSELNRDGRTWYRLRLGFFDSAPEAELAAARARDAYPQAWIDLASDAELAQLPSMPLPPATTTRSAAPRTAAAVVGSMTAARAAMEAGDYDAAIDLYSAVLDDPETASTPEAREMLGLARERNGQFAHAKAEYERYLEEWPKGEDADRVRQRLTSLVGRGSKPKAKLREVAEAEGWNLDGRGTFSTYYRRDERYTDGENDGATQSIADSNLDLGLRASQGANDLRLAFNGGYTLDFLDSDDNETDVNELYVQYARTPSWISARAGRQSRSKGGVLGRFDGMLVGYQPVGWANVNVAAGFPVRTWEDAVDVDSERHFAGVSVDFGTFADHWDFNLFFIDQQVADVTDRRAVGGEIRYFDSERSVFALLDYDVYYGVLNTAQVIGSTTLPFELRADASLSYRTTPILTTSNALIGQPFDSMDDLLDVFSESEVKDFARDRTADGVTFTASMTRDLSERFQLNGDFAVSTLSDTDTSGGVDEIPETGAEFFYGTQLIGSDLFGSGDVSVAGLRYTDGDDRNVLSLDLNTRFPVRTAWRLNPRLVFDYEPGGDSDDRDLRVRPRLRIEYRWWKRHRFEVEGGGQWMHEGTGSDAENVYGYTAEAGYRFDF
jgi:tetratricopeptide (TPR) repeat protein